jgi:hypothetical protein
MIVEMPNPKDTYRTAHRLKYEKEHPRPISLVGTERGGVLIAFSAGNEAGRL